MHAATESSNGFPDWMVLAVPVVCAAAIIYLAYAIHRYGGRERALRRVAASAGLVFSATDPAGIGVDPLPDVRPGARRARHQRPVARDRSRTPQARASTSRLRGARGGHGSCATAGARWPTRCSTSTIGPGRDRARSTPRLVAARSASVDAFLPPCTIVPSSWVSRAFESAGLADSTSSPTSSTAAGMSGAVTVASPTCSSMRS